MRSQTDPGQTAPRHHRNTASLIQTSAGHFAAAHLNGLMSLYVEPIGGRLVELPSTDGASQPIADFVRCSYLGLDNHPAIVTGGMALMLRYGCLHWSCARTRLNFMALGELEDALSELFDARVTTFSTVLAANMSALPLIASGALTEGVKPVMVFDRLAHATLAFNKPVVAEETDVRTIAHNDLAALEEICETHPCVAYICDGVYSMGGSAPVQKLLELQRRFGLFLYIDDAHGISIVGDRGEGFTRSQIRGSLGDRTIIAASLGKGFGASGGMLMLGSPTQEELFRRFGLAHAFSASINVAAIGAALASQALHRTDELGARQARLAQNVALFDELVPTAQAGSPLPIRTVVIGDELAAIGAARLVLDAGSYVSAIFFPTVASGRAGLRICPTADHTFDQIRALAAAINGALER
ncbi:aminotransferase class I/II-fold pyridoxal phosphate-dependent enzyme [Neorhizobium sp. P12A]|jgi:7-keto-8-aminopelargonate synthetase-like enzyme|uniref:8-amino-7-oxononanoate synthase family protein n=1 Tax=Neorhizobium sp. P12A TaxID=2268027 RepID=UPI0011F04D76|nr:aminotransferase class I/II-fold pyridoxal phosphate-dependent enzyme [Neorhizobium sp. P12A]KAA0693713.1 aminotransferase class I/II-fold pyridoxal phosphate-dependent enzyme [Neorhizobium sp. P12A]